MREVSTELAEYLSEIPGGARSKLVLIASALLIVLVVALSLVRVDTIAVVVGAIEPAGKTKAVQAPENGEVREIRVVEGQRVEVGDVVAVLDTSISSAELLRAQVQMQVAELRIERINAMLEGRGFSAEAGNENAQKEYELWKSIEQKFNSTVADLQRESDLKKTVVASALANEKKTLDQLQTARQQEDLVKGVIGTAISRFGYMKYKDTREQLENESLIRQQEVKQARQELQLAKGKIQLLRETHKEELLKERDTAQSDLRSLELETLKANHGAEIKKILATESGVVDQLKLKASGQVVSAGETVAKIVPGNNELIVNAQVTSKDIALIRAGSEVLVKIDAFPYQLYGAVEGEVVRVSEDAEQLQSQAFESREKGGNDRSFTVSATLGKWSNAVAGSHIKIKPGMTVQMDVKTGSRSILSSIFDPITKNFAEAIRM